MPLPTLTYDVIALEDRNVREAFQELVSYLVKFDEFSDALQTYDYLQWLLRQPEAAPRDPQVTAWYLAFLAQLQFIALPALPDGEVEEFFKTRVTVGLFNPEIELWNKVKGKLLRIPVFEQRDPLRARLRSALEANAEMLTDATIRSVDKTLPGTVGNWLADYRKTVGAAYVSTLVRTAYLTNSANTKNLSAKDQEKLKRLIELYEKLKLSSMEDEGMEEQYVFEREGKLFVLREGRLEEAKDEMAESLRERLRQKGLFGDPRVPIVERWLEFRGAQQRKMATARAGPEAIFKEIEQECARLRERKLSSKQLLDLLYNAAFPSPAARTNRTGALSSLMILAERGELDLLTSKESKVRAPFEEWLHAQGKTAMSEGLQITPQTPAYLTNVLRMLLEDKLKMSEDGAASAGSRLGALMKAKGKPQYFDMAYFDAEKEIFVWKS